jgi:hypothetical protein
MASVLVYTNGKSDRVVKRNNIVYVARGLTGPQGVSGGNIEKAFSHADLTLPILIGSLPSQAKVFTVKFDVLSPFNNNVSFSIGNNDDQELLFRLDAPDTENIENYHSDLSKTVSGEVTLYPYYTTQPTMGEAILNLFYS